MCTKAVVGQKVGALFAHFLGHYLFYNLQLPSFQEYVALNQQWAIYPVVSNKKVMKFLIPLPPLPIQQQIVDILDKFHTLVHSLTEGLPAEIALRRQQYEYYRNQLLRFPR